MHLTECLELAHRAYSGSKPLLSVGWTDPSLNDKSPHWECVDQWFYKTTTSFHNHREMEEALVTNAWFGALCFSFTIGGIGMLILRPSWANQNDSRFMIYTLFAMWLILAQGTLSYLADYVYFTKDHVVHVVDRFSAVPGVVMELWKLTNMITHSRVITTILYAFNLTWALSAFLQSQHCQSEFDVKGFIFWHSMWHLYPLVCVAIVTADRLLFGVDEITTKKHENNQLSKETSMRRKKVI